MAKINIEEFIKQIKKCRQTKDFMRFKSIVGSIISDAEMPTKYSILNNNLNDIENFVVGIEDFISTFNRSIQPGNPESKLIHDYYQLSGNHYSLSKLKTELYQMLGKYFDPNSENEIVEGLSSPLVRDYYEIVNATLRLVYLYNKHGKKIFDEISSSKTIEFWEEDDDDYI